LLIEADAHMLEVVTAGYLSQDPVLMQEVRDGVDLHTNNQQRFKLTTRTLAKIFKFRLIYGGSAWSYALDPEFNGISDNPKYWQAIIDEYYNKYQGLKAWHNELVLTAIKDGRQVMPTGRVYEYQPYLKKGEWVWPRTKILNYPVQGLGHDLMAIARVVSFKRLRGVHKCLFVNSVHDSIILDVDNDIDLVYNCCSTLEDVFEDIPVNFRRHFGVEFNLPMKAEVKFGHNWAEMKAFNREEFYSGNTDCFSIAA
jgi:DNA polymerase I-like protein with 3'-5' exonuclease and polymerase domains